MTWTNPHDADFAGVLIRRSNDGTPPISAKDGVLVAALDARRTSFTESGLAAGHSYSYAVFPRDKARNVGAATTLSTATRSTNTATGLKGRLSDQEGRAIQGAQVEIRETSTGNYVAGAATSGTGQFVATGLNAGRYLICFFPTSETTGHSITGYRPGCYRQQPYGYGDTGTPVVVRAGKITSGLVDYLSVAGAISGRVTDSAGHGIANVGVSANGNDPDHGSASTTGPDGSYVITGLAADTYQVCFYSQASTGSSTTGYLDECYDRQPPYGLATPVAVTLGHVSSGINAALEVGAAITGRVSDGNGTPVPNIGVSMYGPGFGYGYSDSTGTYTITGLPTGDYTLCFDGSYTTSPEAPYGYTNTCAGGGVTVEVSAGAMSTFDATVEVAAAVGGTVTGDGGPVAGVLVSVSDSSGSVSMSVNTDENGSYQITGLAPGQVTVCFDPSYTQGGYLRACYHDPAEPDGSATPISLAAGQLSTVDIELQHGASVTGSVTDASGAPISGVFVSAYGNSQYYFAQTDESGSYTMGGVAPDEYTVCFDPSYAQGPAAGGYAAQCYDNQPSMDTATPVTVGSSGTVTVNAVLAAGAAITGRVTGSDAASLAGVYVYAYPLDTGLQVTATTDYIDGSYALRGLAEGDYNVCFDAVNVRQPAATGYVNECFDDSTMTSGTPYTVVHVAAGSVTSGIDAELSVGAEIRGRVTDSAGNGIDDVSVNALSSDGGYLGVYAYVDSTGRYQLTGLPATAVVVCFDSGPAHLAECYDDQPDASTATPIPTSSGSITSGVDAVLADAPPAD
ncbi:MAG TPA: carboxypeptidase regulatory-like domain-containing protein [Jatrophihabitans sp.]|nr:carboxypeptidase regulatory-like domain-containing protein [Jatrophihabitans sp.]